MRIKEIDGLPVMDAKTPITLKVTKNDIARADIKEPANCAVARACRREMHAKEVRVHLGRVYVRTNEGGWLRYMTPPAMRQEIIAFDRGGTFEPGEFTLRVMPPTKRLGQATGGRKPQRGGPKRRPPHVLTNVRHGPAA